MKGNQRDCYQWKAKGQCRKGDACRFRHDDNTRGKVTRSSSLAPRPQTQNDGKFVRKGSLSEAVVLLERHPEDRAEICSRETVRIGHLIIGIFPYVKITKLNRDANSAKSASSCTEVDSQPNKKPKKSGGLGSVALSKNSKQVGCVFQDIDRSKYKSILRKSTQFWGPKRSLQFSKGTLHPVKIWERKGPSQGVIHRSEPHERSPIAPKIEHRSLEETLRHERCARRDAWEMAKNVHKLKEKDKTTFYSPSEVWSLPASSSTKSEERKFVVDSKASMHMTGNYVCIQKPCTRLFSQRRSENKR